MKILVTGAAGFIGFHLCQRLLHEGIEVLGLDNLNDYYDINLKVARLQQLQALPNFHFTKLDISDREAMADFFTEERPPVVIHLAAQAGVRYSIQNPHAYVDSNLVGFVNILEACRHQQISHLIYASSSSVYGNNKKLPFSTEDNVDRPVSLYAATKKANELMVHTYSHLYGLPTTGLRFFTVYGPWGRPDMAYFSFTKAILAGEPIKVFNNGQMRRDFTYIDDVIEGIFRLVNHIPARGDAPSLVRFAKWQIVSRLAPGAIVFEWINDSKFLVRTGETGLTGNIYTGLHEFPEMGFLLHFLREKDLFVDVGANVGSYSILACSVGARGIAFEPVPSTFNRLIENMRLNHLEERVTCLNKGVGAQQGSIKFTSDTDTTNHALADWEHCENVVNVEVTSLDIVLNSESPTLIKIDVEGYEMPVLEGAQEILRKQSIYSVIMELNGNGNRYGYDESKILEMMFDYNFKTYSYNPMDRMLINLEGKNPNSGNTLFIRDISFVEERLKVAPLVSIHGRQF